MGRYPLMAAVEEYLEIREKKVQQSTYKNDVRILRHIGRSMEKMRERGELKTTHPVSMGVDEVKAFVEWMQDPEQHPGKKTLDLDTQVRYLAKLEAVLERYDNEIIEQMREEGYSLPRPAGAKPVRALSEVQLAAIQGAVEDVKPAIKTLPSWKVAQLRMLANGYLATGVRVSELLEVKMEDMNLAEWRIHISKPKGANKYARARDPLIMPPYRPFFLEFLEERKKYLEARGRSEAVYLIPNLEQGRDTHYSSNHFRKLKKELEEASGIKFRLKDFRSSFVSISINSGALSKDVALQVGHRTENTTLRYYHQIDAEQSGQRLERIWEDKIAPRALAALPTPAEDPLVALLNALGVRSAEDLIARLPSAAQAQKNQDIDSKKSLPGYQ